ncbi:MAG: hypothetical protein HYX65_07755 [Gemmatimonadetes bacterium]|nr:hypothetical protein [Gemmatimonadota bacterium]
MTIAEALAALQRAGARFALAELPDRPALATLRHALEAAGFTEVGRVRDYMDDGTDLVLLRRNT